MILKFILKAALSGLLLLTLWQSAPAHAAPTCIKTIEGDRRLSSGIATAMLEEAVFVEHCDGGWSRVRLPDASRRRMRIFSLAGGGLREIAAIAHPAPITTAVMAADLDGDGAPELIYGLRDGSLIITRP